MATTTICLTAMMMAPRAAAAGALLNEIVVPTMSKKAPTSGPAPFWVMPSVKLPSVLNRSGNSVLSRQPNRSGTKILAPGMEDILKNGSFAAGASTAVDSLIYISFGCMRIVAARAYVRKKATTPSRQGRRQTITAGYYPSRTMPPSQSPISPFTKLARSEAKNSTICAGSLAWAARPRGIPLMMR